jgi:hypothetical protein
MFGRQGFQGAVLYAKLAVGVMDVGLAGEGAGGHGWLGSEEGVDGAGIALAGVVRAGKYSAPVWPQPARFNTQAPRTSALTKICFVINMVKLYDRPRIHGPCGNPA